MNNINSKAMLLVAGLVVGSLIGWLTAPTTDVIKLGPLSVEVTQGNGEGGSMTATGDDGQIKLEVGDPSPLNDRNTRTLVFAIIGAIVGLGVGFAMDRRKP
ncbi:MAG: hypothetical protein WD036_00155 [Bauldia sp.]